MSAHSWTPFLGSMSGDYQVRGNLASNEHEFYRASSAYHDGLERDQFAGGQLGRKFLDPSDPIDAMSDEQVRETLHKMNIDSRGFNAAGCRLQLRINSHRAPSNLDVAWYEMHPDVNSLQACIYKLEEENKHLCHDNESLHRALQDAATDAHKVTQAESDIKALCLEKANLEEALAAAMKRSSDTSQFDRERTEFQRQLAEKSRALEVANHATSVLQDTLTAHKKQCADLATENADLKQQLKKGSLSDLGLDDSFDFGKRVYQVMIGDYGIGWRNTPKFDDKSSRTDGPIFPNCIVADGMVQGPNSAFVHEVNGKGWLPMVDKAGSVVCLKHEGTLAQCQARIAAGEIVLDKGEDKISANTSAEGKTIASPGPKKGDWFKK